MTISQPLIKRSTVHTWSLAVCFAQVANPDNDRGCVEWKISFSCTAVHQMKPGIWLLGAETVEWKPADGALSSCIFRFASVYQIKTIEPQTGASPK